MGKFLFILILAINAQSFAAKDCNSLYSDFILSNTLPKSNNLPTLPNYRTLDPLCDLKKSPSPKKRWEKIWRPRLKELFQHYIYGYFPSQFPAARFQKSISTVRLQSGLPAIKKEIHVVLPGTDISFYLSILIPNHIPGKKPVILALNKCGNITTHPQLRGSVFPAGKCQSMDFLRHRLSGWSVEYLLQRGYAFATIHEVELAHDNSRWKNQRVHYQQLAPNFESQWGIVAAWSWGLQRAVDYLVTDENISKNKIALFGHSRRGKAALLAAAFDERVALVIPHQSGTAGMALSRCLEPHAGQKCYSSQETVRFINFHAARWFHSRFKEFSRKEEKLPVDQHLLVSLVAPRAVFNTEGLQDHWANPVGSLRSLQMADDIYKLYGEGIHANAQSDVQPCRMQGDNSTRGLICGLSEASKIQWNQVGKLVQYRINEKHRISLSFWKAILDFADHKL